MIKERYSIVVIGNVCNWHTKSEPKKVENA